MARSDAPPPRALLPPGAERCIWMQAGVLTWKLCDRDLDCERCPLDAALQGGASPSAAPPPEPGVAFTFPADRLYAPSHAWVRRVAGGRVRVGLDALAAALLTPVVGARLVAEGTALAAGDVLAEIDLGVGRLSWHTPVAGRVAAANALLRGEPSLVTTHSYDRGWLAECVPASRGWWHEGACDATAARRRAEADLRRFRRLLAVQLLEPDAAVGPTLQDGGELVLDLRGLVGGERWAELVAACVG